MSRLATCIIPVLLLGAAGCRPASEASAGVAAGSQQTTAEAESEIRRLGDEYISALRAGDVERLVAMYARDAVIHEPGLPAMRGEAAVRQHFAEMADFRFTRMEFGDREVVVSASGDLAVEAGYSIFEWEVDGAMNSERGPYVLVWRRQEGEWRVAREIFNSDQPSGES